MPVEIFAGIIVTKLNYIYRRTSMPNLICFKLGKYRRSLVEGLVVVLRY